MEYTLPKKPVEAEIEAISAKVEALNAAEKGFNERLGAFSEKLGELRYMLVSYGKDIEETKAAAQKAITLVEDVQPSVVLSALRKSYAKAEVLHSKVESNEVLMDKIIAEMKEMRQTVGRFEGLHKLQEVTEELKKSLKEAARLEAEMKRESQMVKDISVEVRDRLKEFKVFDERISGIGEQFKSVLKELDQLKTGFMQSAKLEDLDKVKSSIDLKMRRMDAVMESISEERNKLRDIIHSEKTEKFAEKLDDWLKAGTGLEASLEGLRKRVNVMDELDRKLEGREGRLEKAVANALKQIKKEKETGDIKRRMEKAAKAIEEAGVSYKKVMQMEKKLAEKEKRLKAVEEEMAGLKKDIGAGIKSIILKQLREI